MSDLLSAIGGVADVATAAEALFGVVQPASFRGVPFAVEASGQRVGRRVAVHEYPFRDTPWPEDLGKAAGGFQVAGFLISDSRVYGGGPVLNQRKAMQAAAEAAGPGLLVLPRLGPVKVQCLSLSINDRTDLGPDVVEVAFTFVEAGQRLYPTTTAATGAASALAATKALGAVSDALSTGLKVVGALSPVLGAKAAGQARGFALTATGLVADATSLFHLASDLPGEFGRYFNGANAGGLGPALNSAVSADASLDDLVARGAATRDAVASAGDQLTAACAQVGTGAASGASIAAAAQGVVAAARASAVNPADAVRLCSQLAGVSL